MTLPMLSLLDILWSSFVVLWLCLKKWVDTCTCSSFLLSSQDDVICAQVFGWVERRSLIISLINCCFTFQKKFQDGKRISKESLPILSNGFGGKAFNSFLLFSPLSQAGKASTEKKENQDNTWKVGWKTMKVSKTYACSLFLHHLPPGIQNTYIFFPSFHRIDLNHSHS